jgi:hypothetical protein
MSQQKSQPTTTLSQGANPESAAVHHDEDSGFHPGASTVSADELVRFLNMPDVTDLRCVPGIGEKNKEHLISLSVENTYQLVGKFLSLRHTADSNVEHLQRYNTSLRLTSYFFGSKL